jgi:hypothetical protein
MDWIVLSLTLLAAGMPGAKGLEAVALARETLARELGVEAGALAVQKVEAVEWRDSSLGCPEKGMMYAQVIVPGYRVVLEHGGRAYRIHIGGGRAIRCESSSRQPR